MKVLLAGPNIYDTNRLGGIITVANTILALFPDMEYFARSGVKGKSKTSALRDFYSIVQSFRKRISAGDIELLHMNSALEKSALLRDSIFVHLARRKQVPVVIHLHGGKYFTYSPDKFTDRLIRKMLGMADQIIVLGDAEKEILKARYGLTNVHILRNALDFSAIPARAPKLEGSPVRFVYLGRIDKFKGLDDILEAMKRMKDNNQEFIYTLYGNGPLTEQYSAACREVLGDRFEMGGVVMGADKWKALNSSDVFLLPSLYEGLPMSLLEAMAVGCLSITTAVGSIPEVVHDRENGLIVPKEDPVTLQKLLEEIIGNPGSFRNMAKAGSETVANRFNGDVYRAGLEKIYGLTGGWY